MSNLKPRSTTEGAASSARVQYREAIRDGKARQRYNE